VPKSLRSTFTEMGKLDVEIARKLVELLRSEDAQLAEEIRNDDDKIDALHLVVFDKVLGETWKGEAVDTVDATLASRYHERFADHAVSIAKKVQYLVTGDWDPEKSAN
jgi:phosphate transport system protein